MQEVDGSIPSGSTTTSPSSRGLGHDPFTVATGVRIPVGTPFLPAPLDSCRSHVGFDVMHFADDADIPSVNLVLLRMAQFDDRALYCSDAA